MDDPRVSEDLEWRIRMELARGAGAGTIIAALCESGWEHADAMVVVNRIRKDYEASCEKAAQRAFIDQLDHYLPPRKNDESMQVARLAVKAIFGIAGLALD